MRGRDSLNKRYRSKNASGYRRDVKPYDRYGNKTWRKKAKDMSHVFNDIDKRSGSHVLGANEAVIALAVVPYEQTKQTGETVSESDHGHQRNIGDGDLGTEERKKLASTIVSPALRRPLMDENVTIRSRKDRMVDRHEPVIDALSNMEVQEDDLFDDELQELEDAALSSSSVGTRRKHDSTVSRRGSRSKNNTTLGIQTKKSEFLRRGSPKLRSTIVPSMAQTREKEKARHIHIRS
ncbi:unnamed protein product, partial [Eruca vesicaria subsp. sativa]|nr:unnamed protein product [Eruca vesicaria subsp. sativa]